MQQEVKQRNINFVRKLSSKAHCIDHFMLIKNWIGTIPLTLVISILSCWGQHICRVVVWHINAWNRNSTYMLTSTYMLSCDLHIYWVVISSNDVLYHHFLYMLTPRYFLNSAPGVRFFFLIHIGYMYNKPEKHSEKIIWQWEVKIHHKGLTYKIIKINVEKSLKLKEYI